MSQDALGQLKLLKTARARWPFPDVISRRVPFSPLNGFLSMVALQPGFLEMRLLVHSISQGVPIPFSTAHERVWVRSNMFFFIPTSLPPNTSDLYDIWFLFLRMRFMLPCFCFPPALRITRSGYLLNCSFDLFIMIARLYSIF